MYSPTLRYRAGVTAHSYSSAPSEFKTPPRNVGTSAPPSSGSSSPYSLSGSRSSSWSFSHSSFSSAPVYTPRVHLSRPRVPYDVIFTNEAQIEQEEVEFWEEESHPTKGRKLRATARCLYSTYDKYQQMTNSIIVDLKQFALQKKYIEEADIISTLDKSLSLLLDQQYQCWEQHRCFIVRLGSLLYNDNEPFPTILTRLKARSKLHENKIKLLLFRQAQVKSRLDQLQKSSCVIC